MRLISLLKGVGIGVAAMYFLDPRSGPRRRARVASQFERVLKDLGDDLSAQGRHLRNRAVGKMAEARAQMGREHFVPDSVIEERVRSAIGRHTANARSIKVGVRDGCVLLRGPILAREVNDVILATRNTRGVCDIVSEMEIHQEPGNVPGLQGGTA